MRVDVGVGDRVRVTLAKPRARFPSLAGMMAKCEASEELARQQDAEREKFLEGERAVLRLMFGDPAEVA